MFISTKLISSFFLIYCVLTRPNESATPAPPPQQPATETTAAQLPATQPPVAAATLATQPQGTQPPPAPETPATPAPAGKLNEICNKTATPPCEPYMKCINAGENNDLFRCRCDNSYYHFKKEKSTDCYPIESSSDPRCAECYTNKGICIKDKDFYYCSCPASRTGVNCGIMLVNVTCTRSHMTVCFDPSPINITTNWTDGYHMFVDGKSSFPECSGHKPNASESANSSCSEACNYLPIRIATKAELDTCGTKNESDSSNMIFSNRITVARNDDPRLSFIVYCSFQQYSKDVFAGVGVVNPNGNENGVQVDAVISLTLLDRLGNPLTAGSSIMVGDQVQFLVSLGKGDVYGTLSVLRCTASSSPFFPDSTAETRALISNGCPVQGESTYDSWFFKPVTSSSYQYSIKSEPLKIFKLSTSNVVYFHCTIQLCLIGQNGCIPKVQTDCPKVTKRSVDHLLVKRQASPNPKSAYSYTSIIVRDTNDGVTTNTIVYVIVFSVLILAVVIALVFAAAMYAKKGNGNEKQDHPEVFAMPRLTSTTDRI